MPRQKLTRSRKYDLITLAEEAVEIYSPNDGLVNLDKIIQNCGIGLHLDDYENAFDGALEVSDGKFHIHINTTRCGSGESARARFTKGHELGHFFIDEHRLALLSGENPHGSTCGMFDSAETPEELEADFFAANLLMPPSRFSRLIRDDESPLKAIERMAAYFQSSLTATALHYISNVANRCAIVRWDSDGQFSWNFVGNGYHASHFHKPLYAEGASPLKGSATEEVLSGESSRSEAVSTMSTSFKGVAVGGPRDILLKEEALALGEYGYLTIFSDLPK